MKTTALNVANYLYSKGFTDKIKIQKLLYISFGFYSYFQKENLFDDKIEAWQYGPVIPNVYHNFKNWMVVLKN